VRSAGGAGGQPQQPVVGAVHLVPAEGEVARDRDRHDDRWIFVLRVDGAAGLRQLLGHVFERGDGLVAILEALDELPRALLGAVWVARFRGAADHFRKRGRRGVTLSLSHG
jgi:hypothetical protein